MKTTKWLVSILICTYNADTTIEATILSCLHQTYPNIEILIHDDQSLDNTLAVINKINNPIIKVIHSWKKLWPYGWLNFLLDYAQWEYIAIQDHDDLWHPTKIEKQIEFLESHPEYIWCGTKTLMRYEWDSKWFEYYLWNENYYTIHPSLVFRNQWQRYPTKSVYFNDALFQKTILCWWERKIYNIDETLTLHVIKDGAKNYSYKRFTYTRATITTIFTIHPVWYGVLVIGRETIRKICYPCLRLLGKGKWIDRIERKPFEILGNRIGEYGYEKLAHLHFY